MLTVSISESQAALGYYYENNQEIPESLEALNIQTELPDGSLMTLDNNMALTINTDKGELIFTPAENEQRKIIWDCINGEGLDAESLPPSCVRVEIK